MSYVTTDLLKAFAQTPDSHPDEVWDQLALSSSRAFDNAVEVENDFFAAAIELGDDEDGLREKVIRTNGEFNLRLPPFVVGSLTTIEAEDGFTFPTDYRLEDKETGKQFLIVASVSNQSSEDYAYANPSRPGLSYVSLRDYPYANYQQYPVTNWTNKAFDLTITARWGWALIPSDITQAVIEHALSVWRNMTDPSFAIISDVGSINKKTPLFDSVAEKYRKQFSQKVLFA